MVSKKALFGILALSFFIGACAPKIKGIKQIVPPKIVVKSPVAVLPFDGPKPYAEDATSMIMARLTQAQLRGKPIFKVVEQQGISKVINLQKKSYSGWYDEKTAVEVGKLIAARTVIIGKVIRAEVCDTRRREEHRECIEWKGFLKCKEWRTSRVSCTCRKAYFTFSPKIIDVQSGTVLYATKLDGVSRESKMCDDGGELQDKTSAIKEAMLEPINKFCDIVCPHYITLEIALKKKDKNSPKWVQEEIKKGIEWAKNGRLDRACEIWRNAYMKFPNSLALIYDIGVCEETNGNFEEALKYYKKADRMLVEPDKDISNALLRTQQRIKEQKKFREHMRTLLGN